MSKKEVAILLATYNGGEFIEQQIDSILKQSYSDWKLFIHDDGSDDHTMSILNKFIQSYPDKIFYIEGSSTGSAKSNFFFLTKNVNSDYYMFCDQDDFWLEDKIEITLNRMNEISEDNVPCLVFTDLKVVDANLNIISNKMSVYQRLNCEDNSINKRTVQNVVTGCTMMINRTLRDLMIKPNSEDGIIMHDWWAAMIAAQFGKISYINKSTILYRQHGKNSVGAKRFDFKSAFTKVLNEKEEIKTSVLDTQIQAQKFTQIYNLDKGSLIYKYSDLKNKNKLTRIVSYIRYGFLKSSLIRNIGLLIFG